MAGERLPSHLIGIIIPAFAGIMMLAVAVCTIIIQNEYIIQGLQ
jgi:hypothetical protein